MSEPSGTPGVRGGAGSSARRPVALSVLLVLLALGNVAGIYKTTALAEATAVQFPRLSTALVRALVIVPIAYLVTLPWLWRLRPWAYRLQLALGVAVVALDLWAGNLVHGATAAVATGLLVLLLGRARRSVFGW